MKKLALALGLLSSASAFSVDRNPVGGGLPDFNIGQGNQVPNPGDLAKLPASAVRLYLVQKQIQSLAQKAPQAYATGQLQGLCNDYVAGKNLLLGSESLADYWKVQNDFRLAAGTLDSMGAAFGCTAQAPQPPAGPSFGTNLHIQNAGDSTYCLNLQSAGNGQANNIYSCADSSDQKWNVTALSPGVYRVQNPKYGSCLNLQNSSDWTETNVWSCDVHPDQSWKIRQLRDGAYQFESVRAPGKCLSLNNHSNEAHTVVVSCDENNGNQEWRFY